ncbi:hypothetical protein BCR44DRAFT_39275 [Catenaria anguillulae PL171]|uniref:Uncharacterized protein n=1 Tax=Catenaria anguillulae PL171 TaxID=765915 RepID=A0A1Y2I4A1_9FUNG|nr:hypothetical protein BCR44DRAFT_39275 [Catenaria anguillulae PL171]
MGGPNSLIRSLRDSFTFMSKRRTKAIKLDHATKESLLALRDALEPLIVTDLTPHLSAAQLTIADADSPSCGGASGGAGGPPRRDIILTRSSSAPPTLVSSPASTHGQLSAPGGPGNNSLMPSDIPPHILSEIVQEHIQFMYTAVSSVGSPPPSLPSLSGTTNASSSFRTTASSSSTRSTDSLWQLLSSALTATVAATAKHSASTGSLLAPRIAPVAVVVAYLQLLVTGIESRAAALQAALHSLHLDQREAQVAQLRSRSADVAGRAAQCASVLREATSLKTLAPVLQRVGQEVVPDLVAVHEDVSRTLAEVAGDLTGLQTRRAALQFFAAAGVGVAALASGGAVLAGSAAVGAISAGPVAVPGSAVMAASLTTAGAAAGLLGPRVEALMVGPVQVAVDRLMEMKAELAVCKLAVRYAAWELVVVVEDLLWPERDADAASVASGSVVRQAA